MRVNDPFNCKQEIAHLRELLAAHEKLDELRHSDGDKAVRMASITIDARLVEMNQFRQQITNERGDYLLRSSYEREHTTLSDRVKELEINRGKDVGVDTGKSAVYAGIMGIVFIIVQVVLHFWPK